MKGIYKNSVTPSKESWALKKKSCKPNEYIIYSIK
jgi:hypothetical protein